MSNEETVPKNDLMQLSESYTEVAKQSQQLMAEFLQRHAGALGMTRELNISEAFFEMTTRMLGDPFKLAETQWKLWQDYLALWHSSVMKMMGEENRPPVVEPHISDKRFKDDAWQKNFLFDYIKQSYLIAARHLHGAVSNVEGLDEKTARKVEFYTRQFIDALSPSNFVLTNPEVLRETVQSGGQNLIKGLKNLLRDLDRGDHRQLRIRMTDLEAFKLGTNVATTKGKVVYQNELMQLIQYQPSTKEVFRLPLLIIPPWINKFYVLDLRENNSFIKWAVDQEHTVFVISWVNPDEKLAHKDFEDYLLEGSLAALDAIEKATGERKVNAIGYCLGGTLLAATLGYLAAKGNERIASATFLATLIDFTEPGELGVFVDEQQVSALEKRMEERGYLEGFEMATTFNMLRSNDLIWSFVVNNYLLGKDPFPFDLLFWNSDATRMPAKMHSFYLRNMYIKNLLKKPGGLTLAKVAIDLSRVKTPAYFLSTVEDHIAPWKSTYAGTSLLRGPAKFVLGGSGHIAGVINPPSANKYGYRTNAKTPTDPNSWLNGAKHNDGSWWTDWRKWIAAYGGEKVLARLPGRGRLKALEDAPGSYVKLHLHNKST
ncbi:MAG TPA: class I poly(R)-hydroxyalkanoic acid synthase [Burkholderiales bacterium]|nr:class I poly(R)-hydroxyalkanoic acid synthase [Burkholderiales bacterium]